MLRALEGLPGVGQVTFDHDSDAFQVTGDVAIEQAKVRQAVLDTVFFPRLRRFLGRMNRLRVWAEAVQL